MRHGSSLIQAPWNSLVSTNSPSNLHDTNKWLVWPAPPWYIVGHATIGVVLGIGAVLMVVASCNSKWVTREGARVGLAVLAVFLVAGAATFYAARWRRCLLAGFKPLSPVYLIMPH